MCFIKKTDFNSAFNKLLIIYKKGFKHWLIKMPEDNILVL